MRFVVSLVLLSITVAVQAADAPARATDPAPPEAVARFLMGTRLGLITCSGKYRSYLEKRDLYELVGNGKEAANMAPPSNEDATACVHETVYKGKSLYDAAAKQSTAPAAKTALREYMTAWEASLTGVPSKQPEKPKDFDARQKKQEARLDDLQKRVEATAR